MTRDRLFEHLQHGNVIVVDNQRGRAQIAGRVNSIGKSFPHTTPRDCVTWDVGLLRLNEFGKQETVETPVSIGSPGDLVPSRASRYQPCGCRRDRSRHRAQARSCNCAQWRDLNEPQFVTNCVNA